MIDPAALFFSCLFVAILIKFSVARCCCVDPCSQCTPGTTAAKVQIDFDGIVSQAHPDACADCDDYNTTSFVLSQLGGGAADTYCQYWLDTPGQPIGEGIDLPCFVDAETAGLCNMRFMYSTDFFGTSKRIVVYRNQQDIIGGWGCDFGNDEAQGWINPAPTYDCSADETEIPTVNGGDAYHCDWSAGTFDLTPLGPFG